MMRSWTKFRQSMAKKLITKHTERAQTLITSLIV